MADTKINVTGLDPVDDVQAEDTLLLIRNADDGTTNKVAKRITASKFKGEDAYAVAVEKGYTGTYADWQLLVGEIATATDTLANISEVSIGFDSDTGEAVISVG